MKAPLLATSAMETAVIRAIGREALIVNFLPTCRRVKELYKYPPFSKPERNLDSV
jgi:hypothetical protein